MNLANGTIKNIISAIRTMFRWYGVNQEIWLSDKWSWNLKSLTLANRQAPRVQPVVSFQHFMQAIHLTAQWKWTHIQFSFILGFLGLLRISNLAPEKSHSLDTSRITLLRDVCVQDNVLHISLKWAKNLQNGQEMLKLPSTSQDVLCPVRLWQKYIQEYLQIDPDCSFPLFLHRTGGNLIIMDQYMLRKMHSTVWSFLGLQDHGYTVHSFRRGGATFYAEQGLPLADIKKLGLWRSNAVECYLKQFNFDRTQLFTFHKNL